MAGTLHKAKRRADALAQLRAALGGDLPPLPKDKTLADIVLLEAAATALTAAAATNDDDATALPADFPGRDDLIAAGHTTIAAVRAVTDLTAITGIGKATAAAIAEALAPAPTAKTDDDGQPDASTTATGDGDTDGAGGVSSTATNDGAAA